MEMRLKTLAPAALACIALAACGTNPTDRAISGGGIGAASGAVIGVVAGGPILGAALIGAAAGAVAGAVTDPNKINLGPMPWDH
jgi:uncharacterized membrane protein